jgi:hypothetical protein
MGDERFPRSYKALGRSGRVGMCYGELPLGKEGDHARGGGQETLTYVCEDSWDWPCSLLWFITSFFKRIRTILKR